MPGCGMGLYVMVLVVIFAGGVTGMSLSMWVLWQSGANLSPMNLSYGGVVDPRILAPMRVAGLLGEDEIPDAFHAERIDGSVACAISSGELRRLGADGETERLPVAALTSITREENEVTAVGPTGRIQCFFNPGEGADRFERMLASPGSEALEE
jgi:hypothetical protein